MIPPKDTPEQTAEMRRLAYRLLPYHIPSVSAEDEILASEQLSRYGTKDGRVRPLIYGADCIALGRHVEQLRIVAIIEKESTIEELRAAVLRHLFGEPKPAKEGGA